MCRRELSASVFVRSEGRGVMYPLKIYKRTENREREIAKKMIAKQVQRLNESMQTKC